MRHIYRVYEGCGDFWDYSVESIGAAKAEHLRLNYIDAGVPVEDAGELEVKELPDDKLITVRDYREYGRTVELTARECADAEEGFVGTTCV